MKTHMHSYILRYDIIVCFYISKTFCQKIFRKSFFSQVCAVAKGSDWKFYSLLRVAGSKVILDSAVDPDQGANGRVKSYSIQSGESAIYTLHIRGQGSEKRAAQNSTLTESSFQNPICIEGPMMVHEYSDSKLIFA
jgi:hypothetical protein